MAISIRMIGLAVAMLATGAQAEAVKGAGFTAAFPCHTKQASQKVVAGTATIPIVSYSCEGAGSLYYVVASTYPKGFIAKKTLAAAYKDAVGGAASNVRGTVRTDRPIKLGAVAGRDAFDRHPRRQGRGASARVLRRRQAVPGDGRGRQEPRNRQAGDGFPGVVQAGEIDT
jgi:hypothetical protein